MAYVPPGVTLSETKKESTITLLSTQRLPILIGEGANYKVSSNEAVVRSSTGYMDSLLYSSLGIISLESVGSQKYLNDYKEGIDYNLTGNSIVWTSTGNIPVAGATYYVTYKYNRPSNDYKILKFFNNIEDVLADIGPQTSSYPLVMAAYIGLKILKLPTIGIVQVPTSAGIIDYQDAIDKTKEVDSLVSLYTMSTDFQVQAYLRSHVIERSLPQHKRERIAYLGAAIGTPPGDKNTTNSIAGLAYALSTENVVFVSPSRLKYTYRDTETGLTTTTTVNGTILAACVGMYKDSLPDPSAPILRHDLSFMNIILFDEDRDTFFSEYNMNQMAEAGTLVVYPKGNRILIRDDVTTDTSDVRSNSLNVVIAKHYITRNTREKLDDTFIGRKILNRAVYESQVRDYLIRLFSKYSAQGIIESFDTADMTAKVDPEEPTVVHIRYAYIPIFANKRIEGEYYLRTS